MQIKTLLFALLCFLSVQLNAQSLYEVPLNEKVKNATLIIEGKVIDQKSFWNDNHTLIFTSHTVEVYKIFKGTLNTSTVEIVTTGGQVGDSGLIVSDGASLSQNDVGTYFLQSNNISQLSKVAKPWDLYSGIQGFLKYEPINGSANAPFAHYKTVSGDLYREIKARTKKDFDNRKPGFTFPTKPANNSKELSPLAPGISNFSPKTVTAGTFLDPTNNLLTITGSGFGTASGQAAVVFDNPNDGPAGALNTVPYNSPLIQSWTDTQIKIQVPSFAGTGILSVKNAAGISFSALPTLTVLYSVINDFDWIYEANLIDQTGTGTGGYKIYYSKSTAGSGVDFSTSAAKATFERALATWTESTGVNITVGGTTTAQSLTPDNICTVMFDNNNLGSGIHLPAGTLAICYNHFVQCSTPANPVQIQKTEFDIVIRHEPVSLGTTPFTLGPCPPSSSDVNNFDMETVMLHELGHALNLGHINAAQQGTVTGKINPPKVMYFAASPGVRRISLDYAAKAGGLYTVTPQGVPDNCYVEMLPLTSTISEPKDNCPSSFPVTRTPVNTTVQFDLVHAGSNPFTDPAYTQVRCDGVTGASQTNNAYYAFRTNPSGGILSLYVDNYTTTPAALSSCTVAYGVRLALYKVNSCPGVFPTSAGCTTFNANGSLSISGLAANSNYLLYLEGIENTKATFSLTFGGDALPIKFESFTGNILDNSNQLTWSIGYYENVKKLVLEKSSNGKDYYPIDSIQGYAITTSGSYIDNKPLAGHNYYRLAAVDADGSKQYSPVVILERTDKFLVSIYPNPANSSINLDIATYKTGRYSFDIYNGAGQLVQKQTPAILLSRQILAIPLLNLAAGVYFLKITNEQNESVKNLTFTIKR